MAAFERSYLASHERCGREALAPRKARRLLHHVNGMCTTWKACQVSLVHTIVAEVIDSAPNLTGSGTVGCRLHDPLDTHSLKTRFDGN